MNYLGKVLTNVKEFYNEINSATLTGAIDVVVVCQPNGTYICSPFHVRFGKIGVLHSREKIVDVEVNGEPIGIHMKLGESGEAFFVEEVIDEPVPSHLATSPIPPSPDLEEELRKLKESSKQDNNVNNDFVKSDSCTSDFTVTTDTYSHHVSSAEENLLSEVKVDTTSETIIQDLKNLQNSGVNNEGNRTYSEVPNFVPILKEEVSIAIQTEQIKETDEVSKDVSTVQPVLTEVVIDESEDAKSRRRRKKKLRPKTRPSSKEIKIPYDIRENSDVPLNGTTVLTSKLLDQTVPEIGEDIFQMDEDYNEDEGFSAASMIRSMSLPLNSTDYREKLRSHWPTRRLSATYTGELHPFSDGDVTPFCSPPGTRPPSPKSDTEFEIQKHDATSQTDCDEVSWDWGELPHVPRKSTDGKRMDVSKDKTELSLSDDDDVLNKSNKTEEEKRSMLGGMWNFMRSTKKLRHMPESEGIYLDDLNLNDLDPEIAALYFPKFRSQYPMRMKNQMRDEDAESGNGPSLPQSPHSVEGAIGGPHCLESDAEDRHSLYNYYSKYDDIAMSLCGGLQDPEGGIPTQCFLQSLVTYDDFSENVSIIQDPNLVIRMGGKFYNWQTAAPMLLSMVMFQRLLPEKTVRQLIENHMPKKKKSKSYSWWYWRRTNSEPDAKKTQNSEIEPLDKSSTVPQELSNEAKISTLSETSSSTTTVAQGTTCASSEPSSITSSPSTRHLDLIKSREELYTSTSSETEDIGLVTARENLDKARRHSYYQEKYRKTLRLSSDHIKNLNLKKGVNEVIFSVTTAYQGTSRCKCNIYLWNYDDKIIISDIDGTITKSDVLGHLLPIIGKDWAQLGVAKLFSKVQNNGYQFLYLSARAIGQARITRDYLRSVKQGDICLPDGPLLLSPTSLINALHREVIQKRPEEFKISCLKDIKALFPLSCHPFYAGFGNKINDTWSYRAVDIPMGRIFTINHKGELKLELIQTFQSSYTRLSDVVDHIFPPLQRHSAGNLATNFPASEEFSYFTYWRYPLPHLEDSDELLKSGEK